MGFFDLFKKKKRKELCHMKNMLAVAQADGQWTQGEMAYIVAACRRENISEAEFKKVLEHPETIEWAVPDTNEKRIQYMQDVVAVMMADGDIDDKEMAICKDIALRLGYDPLAIDVIVLDIINRLRNEL